MLFRTPIAPVHESQEVSGRIEEQLKLRGFTQKSAQGKLSYVRGSHFASQVSVVPRKWYANARLFVRDNWLVFELDVDMASGRVNRQIADFWNAEVQGILNRATGKETTQITPFEEAIIAQVQMSQRAEFVEVMRLFRAPVIVALVILTIGAFLPHVLREAFLVLGMGLVAKIWVPAIMQSWVFDRTSNQSPAHPGSENKEPLPNATKEKN